MGVYSSDLTSKQNRREVREGTDTACTKLRVTCSRFFAVDHSPRTSGHSPATLHLIFPSIACGIHPTQWMLTQSSTSMPVFVFDLLFLTYCSGSNITVDQCTFGEWWWTLCVVPQHDTKSQHKITKQNITIIYNSYLSCNFKMGMSLALNRPVSCLSVNCFTSYYHLE